MTRKIILLAIGIFVSFSMIQAQIWNQIGQDIDGEAAGDYSGISNDISADGSVVAIGAYGNTANGPYTGHVRVYENLSGVWAQIGDDIDGDTEFDQLGVSLSLNADGSIVAVGAFGHDGNNNDDGLVRVYENLNGTWTQIGDDIDGEAGGDYSGIAVDLSADGSVVAIGADENNGANGIAGHVRVYENIAGTWTQIGDDIDGEAQGDKFGWKLNLSSNGSVIAIGAPKNDENGYSSGHVRIYENQSGTWVQIGNDIDGEAADDRFGSAIGLSSDGQIVAIGGPRNDGNGNEAGHVRIYENIAGAWIQIGDDIDGEAAGDRSGMSLSLNLDGSKLAIGAYLNDGNGTDGGHVRIYENVSGTWTQMGDDIHGENPDDRFGYSVSLNADNSTIAIGAYGNDGNGTDAGHVRVFGLDVYEIEIVTNEPTNITTTSATGNGTITVTGSPTLIQYGVCWNTTGNPTIADNYTEEGTPVVGDFTSEIIGLTPNQIYYIKAYVTTDTEIMYGNELSFTTLNNVGIESIDQNKISIYPNPTNGIFTIDLHEARKSNISITDISGKIILYENNADENQIDISNFENGIYFIKIVYAEQSRSKTDKKIFTTKIIKQ
ncbi:MAG: T9SS type A sorting domain-containing protein [Bacteroidales bacterium]|nr:T9SS type A sorting domain-containing protein [Bacteroidales bacterium]